MVSFGEEEEERQLGRQEEEWSSPKNAEVLAGLKRPGGHSRSSLLGAQQVHSLAASETQMFLVLMQLHATCERVKQYP